MGSAESAANCLDACVPGVKGPLVSARFELGLLSTEWPLQKWRRKNNNDSAGVSSAKQIGTVSLEVL